MATTVAKGRPVELTSHTPTLMDVEMDPAAQSSQPDEDLYTRLKTLQRQLEFYEIQVFDRSVLSYDLSSAHPDQFDSPGGPVFSAYGTIFSSGCSRLQSGN